MTEQTAKQIEQARIDKPETAKQKRARQIRSLMEDGGWSRKEATALVDEGFGE